MEGSTNRCGGRHEAYAPAICSEEHRVVLNGLTQRCIERARQNNKDVRFSTKGVDSSSSARRYLKDLASYGSADHPMVKQSERVFDYDILTGLFEETEDVHIFSVEYPVVDGRVIMGEQTWEELAANGTLDPTVEGWYHQRSFAEAREAVMASACIESGELLSHDIITISNTSTAHNAGDYFNGRDMMVRHISYDPTRKSLRIDQLMMPRVENEIVAELFRVLNVPVDTTTFRGSEDESVYYLGTQIKVKKGELQNGVADLGFLLDCILASRDGQGYVWGRPASDEGGNPYQSLYIQSRQKEWRRQRATKKLKQDFLEMVKRGEESVERQKELFMIARAEVADIEGREFVAERYGEHAAQRFEDKQRAIESGDMGAAIAAEQGMQREMGDVVICNTVMGSEKSNGQNNSDSLANSLFCARLPKPGEVACCPACRRLVVVAGTQDAIACSRAGCKLEDPKLRARRQKDSKKIAKKPPQKQWFAGGNKNVHTKSVNREKIAA